MLHGGPAVESWTAGEGELAAAPVWIFFSCTTATFVASSIPGTGIDEINEQKMHAENSVLKNAPHTLEMATTDNWSFEYSRQKALYPLDFVRENKFWPSVRRVDEAFGDRNLICSCPPIDSYE